MQIGHNATEGGEQEGSSREYSGKFDHCATSCGVFEFFFGSQEPLREKGSGMGGIWGL